MTDTAKTTSISRETIRESWVNYVGNVTYDLTRAAVDFFLEGALKEMSVYAKTTSEKNDTRSDKFKSLVGKFTDFVRPKTLAMSDSIGSAISYLNKQLLGNAIGQLYPSAKVQDYELDAKNRGWINKAVTAFARKNVKYMAFGGLVAGIIQPFFSVTPAFLTANIGSTLGSLLAGSGLGLLGNQIAPSISQFLASKLKKSEQPKPEEKLKDNQEPEPEKTPTPNPELKPKTDNQINKEPTLEEPKLVKSNEPVVNSEPLLPTSDLEAKLDEKSDAEKEATQLQEAAHEETDKSKYIVRLTVKQPSATTGISEDFVPLETTPEHVSEAESEEENATLQHQARYFTPSADMRRAEVNQLSQSAEHSEDLDSDSEQEVDYDNEQSSSREEGEYSSEHDSEDDQLNRSRSHSRSSNASNSSSSSDSSSRSPSPQQRTQRRRIM